MAVNFWLGRYGTLKNDYIISQISKGYDEIKGDGSNRRSIFWLVPEQKAVLCERRIARELPPSAQLRVEVLNFSRLADKVFREYGGLKNNYLTKGSKKLLVYRALCNVGKDDFDGKALKEYKIDKRRERGFVQLFYDAIGELKSYCVTPEMLEQKASALEKKARELEQKARELEATANTPNEKAKASKDGAKARADISLSARIGDLVTVYKEYERLIKNEKHTDPYDDMTELATSLEANKPFEGATVYISAFDGFTGAQLEVLGKIFSQAKDVYIALDMDKRDEGKTQYKKISATLRALTARCEENRLGTVSNPFGEATYFESPELEFLCDNVWRFGAKSWRESEAKGLVIKENESEEAQIAKIKEKLGTSKIVLMRPDDEFDECERVAGKIKSLIMDGAKYGEIAVVMRSADSYRGIIDYCFDKYDIPYFTSISEDISVKPLIRFIYSALGASLDYNTRDIIGFAKSGYVDLLPDDEATGRAIGDELEEYIYRWGIYGDRFERREAWQANPDGYVDTVAERARLRERYEEKEREREARRARIDRAREQIIDLLKPLRTLLISESATVAQICEAIYALMERLNIKSSLEAELVAIDAEKCDDNGAQSLKKKAERKAQIKLLWTQMLGALDTLVNIMGNEAVTKDGFVAALSYILDEVKLGSIPTGEDNVTIGEAGALRTEGIKYAFVLGVCEGEFPKIVQQSSFFTDNDKDTLAKQSITLSVKTDIRTDDEYLNFKNSIAIPSARLYVSAPRGDIRLSKKKPSSAYEEIKRLFTVSVPREREGEVEILLLKEDEGDLLDKIYTEKIAHEYASGTGAESEAIRLALGIGEQGDTQNAFSNDSLELTCLDELLGDRLDLSQTKVEKYTKCRFWHYCEFLLGLKESERFSFGAKEVGTLSHAVFEKIANRKGKKPIEELTTAEICAEIDTEVDKFVNSLYPKGNPSKKLLQLFERLKKNLVVYVEELQSELSRGKFKPSLFEVRLNDSHITLDNGKSIEIKGAADRVDTWEHDGRLYVRVVDYKTGKKKFSYDDFNDGISAQLFIYLSALCSLDGEKKKRLFGDDEIELVPAGAMYHPLQLGEAKSPLGKTGDAEASAIKGLVDRRGVFVNDNEVLEAQDPSYRKRSRDDGRILPLCYHKDNKKYFVTPDEMRELLGKLEEILRGKAEQMLEGKITAMPHNDSKEHGDCAYCPNRILCRRSK